MASFKTPALRHVLSSSSRALRASNQRRWAQVHDVRFLATTQQPRAITDKYREKLERKARQEGLSSIDELKAAYSNKIDELNKKDVAELARLRSKMMPQQQPTPPPSPTSASSPSSTASPTLSSSDSASSTIETSSTLSSESPESASSAARPKKPASSGIKTLAEILNLPKARELPAKELTAIWRLRNASNPNSLCAVIPAATYATMEATARRYPTFVLPVPREGQGAEIHFLQWVFDDVETHTASVLFTQLAEFKARGEFAQPHTTITHHSDLARDSASGLVLMQGQVVDGRGASVEDARWLVVCLQRFYGGWDVETAGEPDAERLKRALERRRLLEWFSQADPNFTVEKLLEEAERMT
ncbi:ATP11-domain-containing protein [Sodiomyces alkalinus F11]|uniref:ATP11-domain-containing protein n=1 Tax=Sodiomyces alkalinus (strain CBS 110278 / VKM F-3762 / F11) TaxID=1314773 RepID=A0A3N2PZ62_SODAK|nr:ATP11-domain-containing protein [Sodiomyces alkalinus F11]ROT39716.1 ATP11-domain-containing protein [Sodiomyces alkalinus F11]